MVDPEMVLPNLASFRQRGRLGKRCLTAAQLGCPLVELPADLVKSAGEAERTGQGIGEVLTKENVALLYGNEGCDGRFILHTDPGIPRWGRTGGPIVPQLRWSDVAWTAAYAQSIVEIALAVGGRLEAVEVHPGYAVRNIEDLARSMAVIGDAVASSTGRRPVVVLEHKARQKVARTEDMITLLDALSDDRRYGLVVDIPNLWRTYRSRWRQALDDLPWRSIRGMHLHWKHRPPGPDDPIDWSVVFGRIRSHPGPLYVNPEVFHLAHLAAALGLLRRELNGAGPPS